jgi:hypothetical protein
MVLSSTQSNFTRAREACNTLGTEGDLITAATTGELFALTNYVRVLGTPNGIYWVGYQHSNNTIVGVNGSPFIANVTGDASMNGSCVALRRNDGLFVLRDCNDILDGYICQFIITVPVITSVLLNNTPIDTSSQFTIPIAIGSPVNLTCNLNNTSSTSVVSWTVNQRALSNSLVLTTRDSSTLILPEFLIEGIYECTLSNRGRSTSEKIILVGDLNQVLRPPGPLSPSGFIASPYTTTSILVQWVPPEKTYVINPLFLQYTIYYSTSVSIDYDNGPSIPDLTTPVNGSGSYIINNLQVGTTYYISIRASNRAGLGDTQESVAVTSTFGRGMQLQLVQQIRLLLQHHQMLLLIYV